ncbi:MAG: capsule biosynthesis protein [Pseudomonadota bacterium]
MNTKLKASRYNLRRPDMTIQPRPAPAVAVVPVAPPAPEARRDLQPAPARTATAVLAPLAAPTPAPAPPRLAQPAPRPQTPPPGPYDAAPEMLFDTHDDGFGPGRFASAAAAEVSAAPSADDPAAVTTLDAIRREGLTGRQLRLARRLAQKHNLTPTSDYDAVRLLRQNGMDPFQRATLLDIANADGPATPGSTTPNRGLTPIPGDAVKLPQTIKPMQVPSTEVRVEQNHVVEIQKIQQDIARRRRKRLVLLATRMSFFILLPTLIAAWYFYLVATPLYATRSEFVIQQSEPAAAGLGGLFSGTQFATSQDSIAVQGYLQSRDAMLRLDGDVGFRKHFQDPAIDPIQRLASDASDEATYKVYKKHVKIAYDPTEGLIKLEVVATDPETSAIWARQLIGYAEEQVDHLTQRLRGDQMDGARQAYQEAEAGALASQRKVVELQEKFKVLSSEVEVSLLSAQISSLETQLTKDRLSLAQMESNETPNKARMDPLVRRIGTLEQEIADMRSRLTVGDGGNASLATVQGELMVAQADVQTRQLLLGQSLQAMETARAEANRQVRYLSLSVSPTPPDEATYPRAFENTLVTLFIFMGIYLMISMTVAILREQVSS